MADALKIQIPDGIAAPTESDIKKAKRWTSLRNRNAANLSSRIESELKDAVRKLTEIGYKYNVRAEDFAFSADESLREDVAEVMDLLEDEIMELVEQYSLNATDDKQRRSNLLPWLAALHSRNTNNLSETLHERLRQFLYDTEAQIAAMKLAGYNQQKAISRAVSTMHSVYTSPEMLSAFRKRSASTFIRQHGVHHGNIGLSSSGAVNVENFGANTAIQAWSESQFEEAKERGKDGYFCFRGSTFPCPMCDDVCSVFHTMDEGMVLPVHGHCCCYAVFVSATGQKNTIRRDAVPQSGRDFAMNRFNSFNNDEWERSYFSEKANGFVVTERRRLAEAEASASERRKFEKEYGMTKVAADNGFFVEFLHGVGRQSGETYDVRMNSVPADLKSTNSVGNVVKYIAKAHNKQGAESVLLELDGPHRPFMEKLNEAKRKYGIAIFFYFKDDTYIRRM